MVQSLIIPLPLQSSSCREESLICFALPGPLRSKSTEPLVWASCQCLAHGTWTWVMGWWGCHTCTAQPSITPPVSPAPLALPHLYFCVIQSAGAISHRAVKSWPEVKDKLLLILLDGSQIRVPEPQPASSTAFSPWAMWDGLTIKAVRDWSRWWDSGWPISRDSGKVTGLCQQECQIWALSLSTDQVQPMYVSIYYHIDVSVYAYYPGRARGCSLALPWLKCPWG